MIFNSQIRLVRRKQATICAKAIKLRIFLLKSLGWWCRSKYVIFSQKWEVNLKKTQDQSTEISGFGICLDLVKLRRIAQKKPGKPVENVDVLTYYLLTEGFLS